MKPLWTPIYYKDGNLFVVVSSGFIGRSEADAIFIGEATAKSVGEFGVNFTDVALELSGQHPHVMSQMCGLPVAVLSGPVFRKAIEEKHDLHCVRT